MKNNINDNIAPMASFVMAAAAAAQKWRRRHQA
jgi:hypothetical protein